MIRKYQKGDAFLVEVQPEQASEARFASEYDDIEGITLCFADGRVAGVFGFIEDGEGGACCYGLVGKNAGGVLLEAVRFLRRFIEEEMCARGIFCTVMTVKKGFGAGARMAGLLGFMPGAVLEKYFMGKDYQIFERKREYGTYDNSVCY